MNEAIPKLKDKCSICVSYLLNLNKILELAALLKHITIRIYLMGLANLNH